MLGCQSKYTLATCSGSCRCISCWAASWTVRWSHNQHRVAVIGSSTSPPPCVFELFFYPKNNVYCQHMLCFMLIHVMNVAMDGIRWYRITPTGASVNGSCKIMSMCIRHNTMQVVRDTGIASRCNASREHRNSNSPTAVGPFLTKPTFATDRFPALGCHLSRTYFGSSCCCPVGPP